MLDHKAPTFTIKYALIGAVSYIVLGAIIAIPFVFV